MSTYDIERAKDLVNDFCMKEYGSDADFSDMTLIPIAHTTITDDELPVQVYVDLEAMRFLYSVDDDIVEEEIYDDPLSFLHDLEFLDFDELIGRAEDAWERRDQNE